jgi:polyisoprenyl-phosphate glycosyltransferase
MDAPSRPTLSVVAPVFNEEACLEEFHRRLGGSMPPGVTAEFIFVNDGSRDRSVELLRALQRKDPRVKIIDLSRNFGHQIAIKAGLDHARGDAAVIIDADLQDPPEMIGRFLELWREGSEVVYGVRAARQGDSVFKKATAALYYRLIRKISHIDIPLDAGDFRLLGRPVVDALKEIRERNPYLRGLTSWVGFRQIGVPIERGERYAGETKYTLRKMLGLAWNGIAHFSFLPLQLASVAGFLTAAFCAVWIAQAVYVSLVLKVAVPGWTSLMVAVLFLGSIQLMTLGVLGSYVGRNYDEARRRPLYIVRKKEGFDGA